MISRLNPPELHAPIGYHHVTVSQATRHVFLAGQCPIDADGRLVGPDDIVAQTGQVAANIGTALASVGVTPQEVVRTVVYVASPEQADLALAWSALAASPVGDILASAATLLGVAQLGFQGQLVEVDVTAALT